MHILSVIHIVITRRCTFCCLLSGHRDDSFFLISAICLPILVAGRSRKCLCKGVLLAGCRWGFVWLSLIWWYFWSECIEGRLLVMRLLVMRRRCRGSKWIVRSGHVNWCRSRIWWLFLRPMHWLSVGLYYFDVLTLIIVIWSGAKRGILKNASRWLVSARRSKLMWESRGSERIRGVNSNGAKIFWRFTGRHRGTTDWTRLMCLRGKRIVISAYFIFACS